MQHGNELWRLTGPRPIRGDLNSDGKVDFTDYLSFNDQLMRGSGDNSSADLNNDGVVDEADITILQENFGKVRPEVPDAALEVLHPQRVDLAIKVPLS